MNDAMADILARLRPDRWLVDPRANGEDVRVAILDSGVEQSVLEAKFEAIGQSIHPIEGGIFSSDRPEPLPYAGKQSAPHGTTVADIVLTIAPRVRLYSADVFGNQGGCDLDMVIRALHWVMDHWNCKVVNLSLGIPESRLQPYPKRNSLLRAIEEAYYRDVIVIAAAHNEHPFTRSYPAVFAPPLISVDKGDFANAMHFAYQLREQVEFQAFGRGYTGPFASEPATSWAAPHLTGIIARLLTLNPVLKPFEIKTLLYWISLAIGEKKSRE